MERNAIDALKKYAGSNAGRTSLTLGYNELDAGIKISVVQSMRHGDGLPEHWLSVDKTGVIQVSSRMFAKSEPLIFFWLAWGVLRFSANDNFDADNKAFELLVVEYPDFNKQELADDFVSAVAQRRNQANLERAAKIASALGFEKQVQEIVESVKTDGDAPQEAGIASPQEEKGQNSYLLLIRLIGLLGIVYAVCYLFNDNGGVTASDYFTTLFVTVMVYLMFGFLVPKKKK